MQLAFDKIAEEAPDGHRKRAVLSRWGKLLRFMGDYREVEIEIPCPKMGDFIPPDHEWIYEDCC